MSNTQTFSELGIHPSDEFAFSETYFAKIQRSAAFLKLHPLRKEILESGVDQTIKLCKSYPSLSFLLISKESLKSKLVQVFKQLFFTEDKDLQENDLIAFYLLKENELIVKLSHGNYIISLFGFILLIKQFIEFVEHRSAYEIFQKIEKEEFGELPDDTVWKDFRFKGFNFEFFLSVKIFVSRLLRLKGEVGFFNLLKLHQLDNYLEEYHNFKSIKKLFSYKQNVETPKFILKNIRTYSIFQPKFAQLPQEVEDANSDEIFSIEKLLLNLSNQNTSDKLHPDQLRDILRAPNEEQQEQFIQLFSRKLFEHSLIKKQCITLTRDYLRFFTFPTIEGKHKLNIFHKDYCIKRVQSLNPKQASFRLLKRILTTYDKKLILLDQLHINTRQNFQEFLKDFLYKGCSVPEEKFGDQPENVKKLNRRWNKAFQKATEVMAESFVLFYNSFIFEEAVTKAYIENSQDIFNEVKETLFMQNLPLSLRNNNLPNKDRSICIEGNEKTVVIELVKQSNIVEFTFFKGLKKKKTMQYPITKIDHELKIIELLNDDSLASVFADFMPACAIIIANSKESYYLRNQIGVLITKTTGEPKTYEANAPAFVYFYNEPLAETLCGRKNTSDKNKDHEVIFYNMIVQNPILTMLLRFSKSLLTSKNPLFKSGKTLNDPDFIIFIIKMIIKEYLFENGVICSDLVHPYIGKTLQQLLGITTPDEENEIKRAMLVVNKEELFRSPILSPNAKIMLSFLKLDSANLELLNFHTMKIPIHKPHEYLLILEQINLYSYNDILSLRDSVNKILYKATTEDCAKDIATLESICGKESFLSKVVFVKNAINDMFPRMNSKFQNIQRKSLSTPFEEKLLNNLFQTDKLNIKPGCIVEFKIKDIDLKMIRGKVGKHFSGLLMLENIGSKGRTKIQEGELDRFFSKNEIIRGVVKKVFPSILRVDISIADQDISNIRNYLSKFNVLKNFGLENNINFVIDNEKDVPLTPLFVMHERNFDFIDYEHPKVLNINLRDAKTLLREGKKIDFVLKPSPRLQNSTLDLVMFSPKHDIFDVLPIKCNFEEIDPKSNIITLSNEDSTNPEKINFSFDKFSFKGISEFVSQFVSMLTINLTMIYNHENFTTMTKESILNTFKKKEKTNTQQEEDPSSMVIENDESASTMFYFISKNTLELLTFMLFYTDKAGQTSPEKLKVNHEGFIFTSHQYPTLNLVIKDLRLKRYQDEFLHNCGDDTSMKSFLTEIIDSSSNISVLSNDNQIARANDHQQINMINEANNNKNQKGANAREENNNANKRRDESTGRNFGGFKGNTNNVKPNNNFKGKPNEGESNKDGAGPSNQISVNWGNANNSTANNDAPMSWGNNQTNTSEPQITTTSWQANDNNTNKFEKPDNQQPASISWGNNLSSTTPSWGESVPNLNTNTEVDSSWNNNTIGNMDDNNSSRFEKRNESFNNDFGRGHGRGGSNRGRGFSGNNQERGGFDNQMRSREERSNSFNKGNEGNNFRNEGGKFGNQNPKFVNRNNENGDNNDGQRKPWRGMSQNQDQSNQNTQSFGRGGGNRGRGDGNFESNRGRGNRGFQGDRNNRGPNRNQDSKWNDNTNSEFNADNSNNNFKAQNNSSNTETNIPSWGQPASNSDNNVATWGNSSNQNTDTGASWGQPKPDENNLGANSLNNWDNGTSGNQNITQTMNSKNTQSQFNNESSAWGTNTNINKGSETASLQNNSWGAPVPDKSTEKGAPQQNGWNSNANESNHNAQKPTDQPVSWGTNNNQDQPTNAFGWGNNESTNENNDKATPNFASVWNSSNNNETKSSWNNNNNNGDGNDNQNFNARRGRGFNDRGGRGGGERRGFQNNNRPNFSNQQEQGFNNNRGRFNNDDNKSQGFNNNNNDDEGRNSFGNNRGRGRGQGQRGDNNFRGNRGRGERRGFDNQGGFNNRDNSYGDRNRRNDSDNSGFNNNFSNPDDNKNSNNGWGSNTNNQDTNGGFANNSWGNTQSRSPNRSNNQWGNENNNNGNNNGWGNPSGDNKPNNDFGVKTDNNSKGGWGNPSGDNKVNTEFGVKTDNNSKGGWGNPSGDNKPNNDFGVKNDNNSKGAWGTPKHETSEPGKRGIDSFAAEKSNNLNNISGQKRTKEEGPITPKNEYSNPPTWKQPSNQRSPNKSPANANNNGWNSSSWQ